MELRFFRTWTAAALAVTLAAAPAIAHEEEEHGSSHHEATEAVKPTGAATLAGLWKDVKAGESALAGLIQAKELSKVHEAAFTLRDLVAAMPAKSGQLSEEQQKKLAGNVKFVAILAERLDASGDAGDQSATEARFKQLQSVLVSIEAVYPVGLLK